MLQNDYFDQTNIYALYGCVLTEQKSLSEAESFFKKALDYREKSQPTSVVYALLGYARLLRKEHKSQEALPLLKDGLLLTRESNNPIYRNRLLEELSLCYESLGEHRHALNYQRMFQVESDSLFNSDKERSLNDLRIKYD